MCDECLETYVDPIVVLFSAGIGLCFSTTVYWVFRHVRVALTSTL